MKNSYFLNIIRSQNQISIRDFKITNKQIYMDESFKKESKVEAPSGSEFLNRKKSTFTPPDLDVNVTIETIKTNNNLITDINKINDKVNESIKQDIKSKIEIQVKNFLL